MSCRIHSFDGRDKSPREAMTDATGWDSTNEQFLADRQTLGELVEHGPAAEIFNNPKMPLTEAYIARKIG